MPRYPDIRFDPDETPWARTVQATQEEHTRELARRAQNETNINKGQNGTLDAIQRQVAELQATQAQLAATQAELADTVAALPRTQSATDSSTGWGLGAGWNTKATVNLVVPEGKTLANISAVGGAAAADLTTGGLTNASARIVIGESGSVTFEAAKDAGASVVNNIMTPSYGRSFATSGGSTITVTLDLNPLNPAAFGATASNYASLTVIATFS